MRDSSHATLSSPPRLLAKLDMLEWDGTQYLLPHWLRDELVSYLNSQLSGNAAPQRAGLSAGIAAEHAVDGAAPDDDDTLAGHLMAHAAFHDGDPNPTADLMREAAERLRGRTESETRATAALHACEGLDTADLIGNGKGWLTEVVHDAARVEVKLDQALRARCPGNGGPDEEDPVCCQSYEASEQSEPCPPGCCVMAEEKDVRAILAAIEREDGTPSAEEFARSEREFIDPDSGTHYRESDFAEECRSPYCECPEGRCREGKKDMRADEARRQFAPSSAEPIGYAVVMESGEGPFVGCYRSKDIAEACRDRQPASHSDVVVPVYTSQPPTPEAVRVAFDQVNKLAAELASLRSATTDTEAVAWAYRKLMAFGIHNGTMDSAMMMDRLNAILATDRNSNG